MPSPMVSSVLIPALFIDNELAACNCTSVSQTFSFGFA